MGLRVHGKALASRLYRQPQSALDLALLVDFGSTFTKVTAVDLATSRLIGRAQSPSTITTDVSEGLLKAVGDLHDRHILFERRPERVEDLDGIFVRACSSAAGGLRIAVIGNVPGLTAEAANMAALGAGAKVVGVHAFRLAPAAFETIAEQKPDIILLAGGTDGGDETTIRHNARMLAEARLPVPVVIAGNRNTGQDIEALLQAAGIETRLVANVMPRSGVIETEEAREVIRELFMRRITDAKGLDRIKANVPVVLPTPLAVQRAVTLGSEGFGVRAGCGDLIVVDIGGATTDIYSVGYGTASETALIAPSSISEPYSKRTVEGDLGLRWNALTIVEQVGKAAFHAEFAAFAPEQDVSEPDLMAYMQRIHAETSTMPTERWQAAADALLARKAADLAIARHVGSVETYYAPGGAVEMQSGKDMADARLMIGTGGIFMSNPYADRILTGGTQFAGRRVLRPASPQILADRSYSLYAIGLLAESHPEIAFDLFAKSFADEAGGRWVCTVRDETGSHPGDCICCA